MGRPRKPNQAPLFDMAVKESEFPEHEKLRPKREHDWEIAQFLDFAAERGLFLARLDPHTGTMMWTGLKPVEKMLLEFRGVDPVAYQRESEVLRDRYAHVFAAHGLNPAGPPPEPEVRTVEHVEPVLANQAERDRQAVESLMGLLGKK